MGYGTLRMGEDKLTAIVTNRSTCLCFRVLREGHSRKVACPERVRKLCTLSPYFVFLCLFIRFFICILLILYTKLVNLSTVFPWVFWSLWANSKLGRDCGNLTFTAKINRSVGTMSTPDSQRDWALHLAVGQFPANSAHQLVSHTLIAGKLFHLVSEVMWVGEQFFLLECPLSIIYPACLP